ncbi:MAG TPA: hemolysin III family protein, partial [Gaiellaceae bacterium]
MVSTPGRIKPKLRGVFHELAFYLALAVAPLLVLTTDDGRARTAAAVFAGCVAACFGASALYHRPTWRPATRARLAQLDRAGVFMLIAGTYLPFGLLVMSPAWSVPLLSVVWGGALI